MSKRPPTKAKPRTERRENQRELAKVIREREKVARTLPGASAEHPLLVPSASVVEVHARSTRCPLCGGELKVVEHAARNVGGEMLRVVNVRCFHCGTPRDLFFRLPQLH